MIKILYIGFGYVAGFISRSIIEMSEKQVVISRSEVDSKKLLWQPINDDNIAFNSEVSHLLISIPPHEGELKIYDQIKKVILNQSHIKWIGYLSSTSVYGDHRGGWVDERSATKTITKTGKARIQSEDLWKSIHPGVNIYRLAAIYGPGRSAFDRILKNKLTNFYKPNHFFSRIHIEDIVGVIKSSIENQDSGAIYNIADDEPTEQYKINEYAYKLMNIDTPRYVSDKKEQLTEKMSQFYAENKKVSNKKIKDVLSYRLRYPTYREGLNKIWTTRDRQT